MLQLNLPDTAESVQPENVMMAPSTGGTPATLPQRPDHLLLNQQNIETLEGPASRKEMSAGSLKALLARNLGYYIVASFLMGTQQAIQWEGILASVGNDYLVIYQPDQGRYVSGDIYALKFVEFHEGQNGPAGPNSAGYSCVGYRRRDGYQGW